MERAIKVNEWTGQDKWLAHIGSTLEPRSFLPHYYMALGVLLRLIMRRDDLQLRDGAAVDVDYEWIC